MKNVVYELRMSTFPPTLFERTHCQPPLMFRVSLLPFVNVLRSAEDPGMKSETHRLFEKLAGPGLLGLNVASNRPAQSIFPAGSGASAMSPSSSNLSPTAANTRPPPATTTNVAARIAAPRRLDVFPSPDRRSAPAV